MVLIIVSALGLVLLPNLAAGPGPEGDLDRAWQKAVHTGSYAFAMDIVQTH